MIVICDSSPLIALFALEKIDLLDRLFDKVIILEAVFNEVFSYEKLSVPNFLIKEKVIDKNLIDSLSIRLDYGESEVIALALEKKIERVLIDDKAARKIAHSLGLKVIGTLGLLILAKEKQFINEIKPLMLKLIEKIAFRIGKKVLNMALEKVNEKPV